MLMWWTQPKETKAAATLKSQVEELQYEKRLAREELLWTLRQATNRRLSLDLNTLNQEMCK